MKYLVSLIILLLPFLSNGNFLSTYCQNKPDSANYYLKLESGKVIHGNLEYIIPNIGGDYVKVNDTSYYTPDIASFNCSWGYFAKFQLDSLTNKVEIFKRSKEGKIEFYSGKSTQYGSTGGNMGPMAYDYKDNYYTKDKVHLLATNYENLSKSLNDNPVSIYFLKQYKTAQTWEWGLIATGIVGAVAGFYQINIKQFVSGSIITIVSAAIFYLSWTQRSLQDDALKNAIRAYNEK
jgi:hypothetical protein